ncbi:MAG: GMC oxidoreductase [Nitrosomonas sp.]|uniref:GMC oxidoreductase n=1 Tax=Nitrosomonas sp. TaxID=42353 RepID=UPI001A48E1C5|nr:GMC oxidoreductase [Nitrosomonas sp.]MBL8501397.1 hypothetical protein [Nitrosomonas sp.]MCG7757096.1 GMC oxidoreductase [Nitrosomonas sp.]UJO99702.1 MAG: GMC oxidoreductase [Nitrosomonas sp.]UJP02446.1 MAG: GMC oxidoreductase [Nitrosomonas sp.]UJP07211.1 MAG: GMC oxidoreductase [Nitrosomonas sp.]
MGAASSSSNFNHGYPSPGPQLPTGQEVMDHVFFSSKTTWKEIREEREFDFIVIGSGPCGYGFVERIYRNNPKARILMIERGPFFLPEHFQNLPLPFKNTLGGLSETFPWTLSIKTQNAEYIKWQHGMVPFFGGRSTLWSAWCPCPTPKEMRDWPPEVITVVQDYFSEAKKVLNVINADEIDADVCETSNCKRPIYGEMQKILTKKIQDEQTKVESLTRVIPAPLAVNDPNVPGIDFNKFATPGPLLEIAEIQKERARNNNEGSFEIVTNCVVQRILQQANHGQDNKMIAKAVALETSRGVVNIGEAKLILAMGTLPPTTLLQNSFPNLVQAGRRFTAHFITSVAARIPRKDYEFREKLGDLELAAIYIAGEDKVVNRQFHIQMSVLSDRNPKKNAANALRHMPDVVATASMAQLLSSEDYLVFICAVLGELDESNTDNHFLRNGESDPTTNDTLQALENDVDATTWNTMDDSTFQVLEKILSPKGAGRVEYWHGQPDDGKWLKERPRKDQIRVPGLVHEGSTLFIGKEDDPNAVVGLDYRPKGVENVYVTGGGLWPTSGSWNPTPTMVALAQNLADRLCKKGNHNR